MRFDSSLEGLNLAGTGVARSESVTDLNGELRETRVRKSIGHIHSHVTDPELMQTPPKQFGIGQLIKSLYSFIYIFGMLPKYTTSR